MPPLPPPDTPVIYTLFVTILNDNFVQYAIHDAIVTHVINF